MSEGLLLSYYGDDLTGHNLHAVAEAVQGVVDTPEAFVGQDIAGNANHEQVVESLPENHFDGDSGVGTADDDRER